MSCHVVNRPPLPLRSAISAVSDVLFEGESERATFKKFFQRQLAFFDKKIEILSTTCTKTLADSLQKLRELPLPQYSEDDEDTFLQAMLKDKAHNKLSDAATDVEDSLSLISTIAKDLGIEMRELVAADIEEAEQSVNRVRCAVATTTVLRILRSKAASQGSAGLLPNIELTCGFIEENNVKIPEKLLEQFHKLRDRLQLQTKSNVKGKK